MQNIIATHYHQLVGLANDIEILKNIHVQVSQNDGKLKFLHTIADGPCDESYGIQVAALLVYRGVVERATDLLQFLENKHMEPRREILSRPQPEISVKLV